MKTKPKLIQFKQVSKSDLRGRKAYRQQMKNDKGETDEKVRLRYGLSSDAKIGFEQVRQTELQRTTATARHKWDYTIRWSTGSAVSDERVWAGWTGWMRRGEERRRVSWIWGSGRFMQSVRCDVADVLVNRQRGRRRVKDEDAHKIAGEWSRMWLSEEWRESRLAGIWVKCSLYEKLLKSWKCWMAGSNRNGEKLFLRELHEFISVIVWYFSTWQFNSSHIIN